ncbi:MAG: hypothetical protein LBK82_17555 [Planctomycetaceae bacterium]|jgi:uncharacterized protein (DUF1778 family)|nr:hypothetical protein [Planctomycetaceae bacterium]
MSPKDKNLVVRLEPDELEYLRKEAESAGFKNVSDFVRYMTIGEGRSIQKDQKKILEILQKLEGLENLLKEKQESVNRSK